MLSWITANAATIAVSLVLLWVVAAILRSLRKRRGSAGASCGGSCAGCGCGCSHCPSSRDPKPR